MAKCPICNSEILESHDVLDGCLMEDTVSCPKGCFSYEYLHGHTEIQIFKKRLCFYHTFPHKERVWKIVDRLVARYSKKNPVEN